MRNKLKVAAALSNATAFLQVQAEFGAFADYLWGFVDGTPVVNAWEASQPLPAQTPLSQAVSRDLRRRGFRFVGPTVCYAYLQSAGLVMDHVTECFRFAELGGRRP